MTDSKREGSKLETQLARWAAIHRAHQVAQSMLREARRSGADGTRLAELEADVHRLQASDDAGLEVLQKLFDSLKPEPAKRPTSALQRHLDLD